MSKLTSACLAGATALALTAGPASAGNAPNQGDPSKVLKVDNPHVSCAYPQPGPKIEGGLKRYITFYANAPIDFVTVKSGEKASVIHAWFDRYEFKGTIKVTQDVSNYVVWTCPKKKGY